MALSTLTFAAATCSWIDPATGLPEIDANRVIGDSQERSFFLANKGYRFCNFTEVSLQVDFSQRQLVNPTFTADSGMYRSLSYGNIPSHAFPIQRQTFVEDDAVRFTQVTGARTVSPESLGMKWGDALGELVARQLIAFPPIWSKIQIRIYKDGRKEAQLLQHSIFPSLTFYQQVGNTFARVNYLNGQNWYDATKLVQLPDWKKRGWGPLQQTNAPGPTAGSPWGTTRGFFGGEDAVETPIK
jgi:hypothetical protein